MEQQVHNQISAGFCCGELGLEAYHQYQLAEVVEMFPEIQCLLELAATVQESLQLCSLAHYDLSLCHKHQQLVEMNFPGYLQPL